ncbi:MAG: TonB-dependent receptor plug domain-containing protein [Opitutaceae bacterium]
MNPIKAAGPTGLTRYIACASVLLLSGGIALAQQAPSASSEPEDDEMIMLSPFEVSDSGDSGYYATNSISGSRINVAIQDIPLSIEVVTSDLIEDTGSVDLRQSLQYSAGVLLTTQNDGRNPDQFSDVGGVNNPEGVTNNKTNTSFKVRGFVTDDVLRDGFRRQHATDSINIERIEVVRGPSALLYGIGNFGGIVNYLIKKPTAELQQNYTFMVGTDSFFRGTADISGPFKKWEGSGYRINLSAETGDDWTDLKNHDAYFIAPIFQFQLTPKTTLVVDGEYGKNDASAIGFQSVRSPSVTGVPISQPDRLETYGFHRVPGEDVRTFRWSGPDTYLNTEAMNFHADLTQEIIPDMYVKLGTNISETNFDIRDVFGAMQQNVGPESLRRTVTSYQVIDGQDSLVTSTVPNSILQYAWVDTEEQNKRYQYRAEWTWTKEIFEDNKWLSSKHSFLAGYSQEDASQTKMIWQTNNSTENVGWNFKAPDDANPIRFGTQGDGSPDVGMSENFRTSSDSTNKGLYGVYSGRFFEDRLFLLGGLRNDKSSTATARADWRNPNASTSSSGEEVSINSAQWGVSVEVIPGVSLFALGSEGVQPNFGGKVDALGNAMDAATSSSNEYGVKLNLIEGKLAATISAFKIERVGVPTSYWWAPAPGRGAFRRGDDIIYNIADFKAAPDIGDDLSWKLVMFTEPVMNAYAAAKESGAIYNKGENTYINASTQTGAAYLDSVFAGVASGLGWPGWLYVGVPEGDPEVNTAGEDWSEGLYSQSISDSSEGYEAQFLFSPLTNMQIILNYSHVTRQIDSPGTFTQYPYEEGNWDRWAMWYFPDGSWGLSGYPATEAYPGGTNGLPNQDTSSWAGLGYGAGESLDDSPEHVVSVWSSYSFSGDGALKGLQLGLGGVWESEREYASSYTSSGQIKENQTGKKIQAFTDPRLTINAMVKYDWVMSEKYNTFVQLNVDNLLNDTDQYGLLYAPGLSARMTFGIGF